MSVAPSGARLHCSAGSLAREPSAAGAQKTVCARDRTTARAENTVHACDGRVGPSQNGVGAPERRESRLEKEGLSRKAMHLCAEERRWRDSANGGPRGGMWLHAPADGRYARELGRSVAVRHRCGEEARLPSRAAFRCVEWPSFWAAWTPSLGTEREHQSTVARGWHPELSFAHSVAQGCKPSYRYPSGTSTRFPLIRQDPEEGAQVERVGRAP